MSDLEFTFTKAEIGITAEEFEALDAKGSGGKYLNPGIYELEIVEANHHEKNGSIFNAKDPTWLSVKIKMAAGDATKDHWLMVPTSKILFDEGNCKQPTFAFRNFREFMNAIGESVSADAESLRKVVPKLFQDPKALVGKKLKAELGYKTNYLQYSKTADGIVEYRILDKAGKEVNPTVFSTTADAVTFAVENNIAVKEKTYCEVLKFMPAPPAVKKEVVASEDKW
jgi:hypothetical protein